jgi:radical SAM protein with 4Fe4S-binding SPASM domain
MPELLLNIRRLNDRCYIGFNTNATLIDEKRAETIMEARVNEVIFSVDGATAETYNRIRVGANFDTTLRNIRRITTLRDRNPNLRLGILLTATKSNYQEIPDLIKLASDLGLNRVMINGTEPYDEKTSHDILYSTEPSPDIVEFFEEIVLQAQDLGMDIQVPLLKPLDEPTFCPSLSTMLIRADGEVYPCSYFSTDDPFFWFGERRKHLGPISFGNIAENPIDVIWNSERYVQFRAGLKQGKFHPECRQCLLAHGVTCNAQIFRIR